MFLNLSPSVSVKKTDIIGIFDMDNATVSSSTRAYLRNAEKKKALISVANDIPKSFVVTDKLVYLVRQAPISLKAHI